MKANFVFKLFLKFFAQFSFKCLQKLACFLDIAEVGNDKLSLRLAVIRHHLKIEAAIAEGSKNVVKTLSAAGKDKKGLQEVRIFLSWFITKLQNNIILIYRA